MFLVVTTYSCARQKNCALAPAEKFLIFHLWDVHNSSTLSVKRLGSPALKWERNTHKGIVYLQLSEPINTIFYPPCRLPWGNTHDPIKMAFLTQQEETSHWIRLNNCPGVHNRSVEICFVTVDEIEPQHGAVIFDNPGGQPGCVIGIYYRKEESALHVAIRLDFWWDRIMQWFVKEEPANWTQTSPIFRGFKMERLDS